MVLNVILSARIEIVIIVVRNFVIAFGNSFDQLVRFVYLNQFPKVYLGKEKVWKLNQKFYLRQD